MIIAGSERLASEMVDCEVTAAGKYWLAINKDRSQCLVLNNVGDNPGEVSGVELVNEIKYLGVTIVDIKNYFIEHKRKRIDLAGRTGIVT